MIKRIINGKCNMCGTMLPPLTREGSLGGWDIVDCPKCGKYFDVPDYINLAHGEKIEDD